MALPLGSAPGIIVGVGVGSAAAAALEPAIELPKQKAWADNPNRLLDAGIVARLVAQGGIDLKSAQDNVRRLGFSADKLDALVYLSQRVPAVGEALALWRRSLISDALFEHVLVREGYDTRYTGALASLKIALLDPNQIAAGIHRGLLTDPGLLKGEQPSGKRNVDAYPVYDNIDPLKQAAGHGYTKDELGVLVGLQGLPMGVIEAAQSYYRDILTKGDYIAAFNESNNRNEWAEAVLEYARQIPTARDFIENALRGYRTLEEAQKGAALHGMSPEHARLIFQNSGRPLNLHQITQALAWGAKYNPLPGDDPDPYMNSVLIGAVTPAYYEMQDTLKYNLPSAFFFRVLQQQNVLTEPEAVTWYKRLGWPPALAEKVASAFATDTSATVDPYVKKAETQLWTATHRSYVSGETDEAGALANLQVLGIGDLAQSQIIGLWTNERETRRKQLTPAQVKKAWVNADTNPATGAPWTRDEAVERLISMGYSANDASTFLEL